MYEFKFNIYKLKLSRQTIMMNFKNIIHNCHHFECIPRIKSFQAMQTRLQLDETVLSERCLKESIEIT